MKTQLRTANSFIVGALFLILGFTKIEYLFLTAFTLLVSIGVKMFIKFHNDEEIQSGTRFSKSELNKITFFRILMQLLPILFLILIFYIVYIRKPFWTGIFMH
jgi:hypothetical protein